MNTRFCSPKMEIESCTRSRISREREICGVFLKEGPADKRAEERARPEWVLPCEEFSKIREKREKKNRKSFFEEVEGTALSLSLSPKIDQKHETMQSFPPFVPDQLQRHKHQQEFQRAGPTLHEAVQVSRKKEEKREEKRREEKRREEKRERDRWPPRWRRRRKKN